MPEMHASPRSIVATLTLLAAVAGCHRRAVTTPAPANAKEEHCWESVMRSPLAPDSVARAFTSAYFALGLTGATRVDGDTAWTFAGPTLLDRAGDRATYAARMVAVRAADGTHFRSFVAVTPPPGGWAAPGDTANGAATRRTIGFCTAVSDLARVGATRGSLDGEESLPVWRLGRRDGGR